ncbi:MAG: ABC transporter ATP-binding protein [Chelatococcus sp.]|uniref:ABC transporter ATP-binding protein n=1 Tax=Chelatococcus sp. TaxID=1953771 RepID=UPI0025C206AB|nr:ABC transporter ATP-binding protein [Chelatococcus sp.]MBX3539274.1 ABC transporter ATP-binding protein [Chelatococcus sp.]
MSGTVEIVGVTKRFGSHLAVDDISFGIGSGEFFSLLGPSGCGKSTTLRMLSGFEAPDTGAIRIAGQDMTDVPPYRRPTNIVFQRWALFPHMSVEANVAFGLEAEGRPRAEIRSRVGDALALVGLSGFAGRKPGQLSGGQMQRVALARALVKRPKVLLLDEPLSALDLKLRHQMQIELKRIQQEIGTTFIFVTHDQGEALAMSDKVAVMNAGRVEQIASPQELYDAPATRFVAGFIGHANLLPVTVEGPAAEMAAEMAAHVAAPAAAAMAGGLVRVRLGDLAFATVAREALAGDATLALRFERVRIGAAGGSTPGTDQSGSARATGVVRQMIFGGSTVQYVVGLDAAPVEITAEQPHGAGATVFTQGTPVTLTWEPADGRLFKP